MGSNQDIYKISVTCHQSLKNSTFILMKWDQGSICVINSVIIESKSKMCFGAQFEKAIDCNNYLTQKLTPKFNADFSLN